MIEERDYMRTPLNGGYNTQQPLPAAFESPLGGGFMVFGPIGMVLGLIGCFFLAAWVSMMSSKQRILWLIIIAILCVFGLVAGLIDASRQNHQISVEKTVQQQKMADFDRNANRNIEYQNGWVHSGGIQSLNQDQQDKIVDMIESCGIYDWNKMSLGNKYKLLRDNNVITHDFFDNITHTEHIQID